MIQTVSFSLGLLMADFKAQGINNISRLAINLNSNQISLVSD